MFLNVILQILNFSSSIVNNIIKRLREYREISVRKRQNQQPILDLCDLQALRQQCIKNRHDSVTQYELRNTSRNRSLWTLCHPQIQVEVLSCTVLGCCSNNVSHSLLDSLTEKVFVTLLVKLLSRYPIILPWMHCHGCQLTAHTVARTHASP